jgi:hypothetical protein
MHCDSIATTTLLCMFPDRDTDCSVFTSEEFFTLHATMADVYVLVWGSLLSVD